MTKRDIVLDLVREAILSGVYSPGDKILQDKLAEELNISQTPIREALRVLEAEGVIKYSPHKGVRVANMTVEEVKEIYEIRRELEPLAVHHAVPNISKQDLQELWNLQKEMGNMVNINGDERIQIPSYRFHMLIYKSANMPELLRIIKMLWSKSPHDVLQTIPGRDFNSLNDHEEILLSIEKRDVAECKRQMRKHLDHVLTEIVLFINEQKKT